MDRIEGLLRDYIAQNILYSNQVYPYPDNASFLEEGIIDSTSILELVMYVEDKFGFTVKDRDIVPDNFDSISNLAEYVRRNILPKLD
jgi:acyl carrier protein